MSRVRPWREGVALEEEPSEPQKWAWVLGASGLGIGGTLGEHWDESSLWAVGAMAVAMVAAAGWQVLYRRDIADRLQFLAWAMLLAVVLVGLLTPLSGFDDAPDQTDVGKTFALAGLIAGLVLTEQWLRSRDPA